MDKLLQEIMKRFPETRTLIEAKISLANLEGNRGDVFLRVPNGDFDQAKTFYQASAVHVSGKYLPHFHNLTEGYSRKVPRGMKPLVSLSDWDPKSTLLQASNYIPHNEGGKDLLIKVCTREELNEWLRSMAEKKLGQ